MVVVVLLLLMTALSHRLSFWRGQCQMAVRLLLLLLDQDGRRMLLRRQRLRGLCERVTVGKVDGLRRLRFEYSVWRGSN